MDNTCGCSRCTKPTKTRPIFGQVELNNGLVIPWLRFAESEDEAIRVVTAQAVHVKRCWVD